MTRENAFIGAADSWNDKNGQGQAYPKESKPISENEIAEHQRFANPEDIAKTLSPINEYEEPLTEHEKLQSAAVDARVELFHDEIESGDNVITLGDIKESNRRYAELKANKEKEILDNLPGLEKAIGNNK